MTRGPLLDIDHIDADRYSALGDQPVLVLPSHACPPGAVQAVILGIDREGTLEAPHAARFDVLLTVAPDAPAPWISVPADRLDAHLEALTDAVHHTPVAATTLVQTLRITEQLPFADGLMCESHAYSMLLGGGEFRRWLGHRDRVPQAPHTDDLVRIAREGEIVTLTLNDPANNNAMTASMRDALYAALANALDDPTAPQIALHGTGKCFSTGGHLPEFGTAQDLATAHVARTLHSCARALHELGDRASVTFHGACIGSGLEVPAAAARRSAMPDAWFQLPELAMGLIPGAGGTVTASRAIGRHRTAWMLLSGKRVSARQALQMGLIHEILPA